MRVTALASGSSGNAYLVQTDTAVLLVDAGLPLIALVPSLAACGVDPTTLTGVLLTHEHGDHLASAAALGRRYKLPLFSTQGTLDGLRARGGERQPIHPGEAFAVGGVRVTPFSVPHDSADPVGFLLEADGARVALATDLGHVPDELLGVFRQSDLLVLEANHDLQRLWYGPYPRMLKERVAAPTGHLSNDQTAECLARCASGRPQWVWLAHLSETNNSPKRALETVKRRLATAAVGTMQVEVALRDRPSISWASGETYFQARMF